MNLIGNKPWAYYNENNAFAAACLRELIKSGHIAPGEVDERSIEDVAADDITGFVQCHWFAGVGVWPYALRLAGWPEDRPVWTGSCPCPPFSVAGKKKSCPECGSAKPLPHAFRTGIFRCTACGHDWHADGRHLWPEFYRLIRECRPHESFGEQVAGRDGLAWGDIVQATLELENYAVGRVPFGACSVGAPHIRQRVYWVAARAHGEIFGASGSAFGMADANGLRCERQSNQQPARIQHPGVIAPEQRNEFGDSSASTGGLADTPLRGQPGGIRECGSPERSTWETGGHCPLGWMADTMPTVRPQWGPGQGGGGSPSGCSGTGGVGDSEHGGCEIGVEERPGANSALSSGDAGRLGDSGGARLEGFTGYGDGVAGRQAQAGPASQAGAPCRLEHSLSRGCYRREAATPGHHDGGATPQRQEGQHGPRLTGAHRLPEDRPGPTNGFWRDSDWLLCRDGKWRPVRSGSFPLASRPPARVGRLRNYGNAINAEQAATFIRAYMDIMGIQRRTTP